MSKLEKKYYPLVFVVPALIIFTLFYVCSIAGGFVFSFTKYSLQGTTQGNGLAGGETPVRFSM